MSKRARYAPSQSRRTSRPVDKQLISATGALTGAQVASRVVLSAYPCTLIGLRWSIGATKAASTGVFVWAIVVVPEGTTESTLVLTNEAAMYSPEQNVVAFGVGLLDTSNHYAVEGSTKAMRKFKVGDKLLLIAKADGDHTSTLRATVQCFLKG